MVVRNAERIACFSISSRGMIAAGTAAAVPAAGFSIPDAEVGNEGGVEVGTIGGVEKFRGEVVPGDGIEPAGAVGACDEAGAGAEKTGSGSGMGGLDDAEADTGIGALTKPRLSVGRPSAAVEIGRPVSERMTARSIVFWSSRTLPGHGYDVSAVTA